ncbi:MAG: acetylglutamate kinase [Thermodesulfobacteriota bacterium]|nr:acetylglutamate kinase [Thermodesulfobacteriota bacterium]
MEHAIQRAKILIEALPYIRDFKSKRMVIKYGGHAMTDPELKKMFAKQITLLKYVGIDVAVVHGGGPQIGEVLKQMGMESRFVNGRRVTDSKTMNIVEMVLAGWVNKEVVNLVNTEGGRAVGLSGKDGGLIQAEKLCTPQNTRDENESEPIDMGYVGEVTKVDPKIIDTVENEGFIPVIAPLGVGADGQTYNINADLVAAEIATSLGAEKFIILTDEKGVLDRDGRLISSIDYKEIPVLIDTCAVTGGMIPKLECCKKALDKGITKAHIIDGRAPYSILLELFTDSGIGTQIVKR